MQKALVFVSRCQNFESPHNTAPFAAKNPDGGFYHTCAAGGVSAAGNTPNGGSRSYGSMTYSGLKSMIYAGLKADDPRVKAAVAWLRKNYDLKNNPGLGTPACIITTTVPRRRCTPSAKIRLQTRRAKNTTGEANWPRNSPAGSGKTAPG